MPDPEPGQVVRYGYLWRREAEGGATEGRKDRPCAVVVAVSRDGARWTVAVAPITHSAPAEGSAAVEIPAETKVRLGLDDERSWIVTDEVNVFVWPGPDLRPIEGRDAGRGFVYGYLPRLLTRAALIQVRRAVQGRTASIVQRG